MTTMIGGKVVSPAMQVLVGASRFRKTQRTFRQNFNIVSSLCEGVSIVCLTLLVTLFLFAPHLIDLTLVWVTLFTTFVIFFKYPID